MKQSESIPIIPTLRKMNLGDKVIFPKSRKKSVRTSASELKDLEGLEFKTWMDKGVLFVERKS